MTTPNPAATTTLFSPQTTTVTAAEEKVPDPAPEPKPQWELPLLRLKVNDVMHEGAQRFFAELNGAKVLKEAVEGVLESLYTVETAPTCVRSVTLVLRSMGGVAYTTGSEIDNEHKEIHFSMNHIARVPKEQVADEILGVVRHEMVHCWQYDGFQTCPGGLIEGIADWVRLRAGFCPPHWSKGGRRWDEGYQHTAYFLDWCETRCGEGFVRRLNAHLKTNRYEPKLWKDLTGCSVKQLWKEYTEANQLEYHDDGGDDDGSDGGPDHDNDSNHGGSQHSSHEKSNKDDTTQNEGQDNEKRPDDKDLTGDMSKKPEAQDEVLDELVETGDKQLQRDPESYKDWPEDEQEAYYIRCVLQKTFLAQHVPTIEEVERANKYISLLETIDYMPRSVLERSKIHKVLQLIVKVGYPLPAMESTAYNFRTRCHNIVQQWAVSLALGQNHRPISPTGVVGAVSPNMATTKQTFPGLSSLVGTSEQDSGVGCDHTCASVIDSDNDDGSSSSHPTTTALPKTTPQGMMRPESPVSSSSGTSTSSGESSSWGFPGPHEPSIAAISRRRLGSLTFRGQMDGKRFIGEFEKLIERVQADMSDDDKRILLVTSFAGEKVNSWYENLDLDDSMPYEDLKAAFVHHWEGASRKKRRLLDTMTRQQFA